MEQNSLRKIKLKMLILFPLGFLVLLLLPIIPAGTWRYWQAWLFVFLMMIPSLFVSFYFLKKDPQFLARRMRYQEKEKTQKNIISLALFLFLAGFILAGLDFRYQWTPVPEPFIYTGAFLFLSSYVLVFLSFRENSYAARTVEIFEDQKLIDTGPYALVRHPMYTGTIMMFLTIPLILGSYITLLPFSLLAISIIPRIFNEEEVLKKGLAEYKNYCQQVPYRLIPYVW